MFCKHIAALSLALITVSAAAPITRAAPPLLSGQVAEQNVSKLTDEIQWYHSLPKAEAEAQKENKLIFWMHMLGHIDGAT